MTRNSRLNPFWHGLLDSVPAPRVVTLVGGGGKTSLMYYLVAGLRAAGDKAFAAATAHLLRPEADGHLAVSIDSLATCRQAVAEYWDSPLLVTLAGRPDAGNERKLSGLEAAWVDAVAAGPPAAAFVVEGDGSAGLPLKGHLEHEPVVPASTRLLVPVVGADVLGRPLDTPCVHRPARAAELAGVAVGDIVTPEIVARLLLHPQGYLHNCPPSCLVVPFINKAESPAARQAAYITAETVLASRHPALAGVMVGSIDGGEYAFYAPKG